MTPVEALGVTKHEHGMAKAANTAAARAVVVVVVVPHMMMMRNDGVMVW
jgi:hypothetical protein